MVVDHAEATPGAAERDGETAGQRVTLTGPDGRIVTYRFGLSRDRPGDLDACWPTHRVVVDCVFARRPRERQQRTAPTDR